MKIEIFSTSDIWLGALLLAESDAKLADMQVSRNGRETVMFCFQGDGLSRLAQAYCRDEAVANVARLRLKINFLRDLIFDHRAVRREVRR